MHIEALQLFDSALRTGTQLHLWHGNEGIVPLEVDRWRRPADEADLSVLDRTDGPTLDVGCGPGRMLVALHARQRLGLGVDISRAAVDLVRTHGLPVLHRSVFDPLPREGGWSTVLLLDGNIGIGGDPELLLYRLRALVAAEGAVVVEVQHREVDDRGPVRFVHDGAPVGAQFGWARVGAAALHRYACATGYEVADQWTCSGRTFALLHLSG